MKKYIVLVIICLVVYGNGFSQLYSTRNGFAGFYSKRGLEDINAENNQVYAIVDLDKKNLAFSLLLKGFVFKKELMQTHFNENYVESDKYPKASFIGKYTGEIFINKEGLYKVMVTGNLTLHNITQTLQTVALFEIKSNILIGTAEFKVKPKDFNITIPAIVREKIADEITVKIKISSSLLK